MLRIDKKENRERSERDVLVCLPLDALINVFHQNLSIKPLDHLESRWRPKDFSNTGSSGHGQTGWAGSSCSGWAAAQQGGQVAIAL